ncbi:MAG: hypothetical protein O2814_04950 [Bacteroidetes bacterium]|nr:hypothetical protein [Bacteroidota bacterium]MDA1224674.1 hypothetical protein [Bacteroidota bacterium]
MEANKTPLLEVLNNLASIHHEVRNDQIQLLGIEKLGKLKLLAAQLYMEVDIELLSMEFPELQETDSETDSELPSDASSDTIVEPTSDLVIDLFVAEVEIATEVIEGVQVAVPDPKPAPVIEPNDRGSSAHTLAGIIGQFPMSRRFEFSNILFGGDMDNMGLFVQEIIDAPNAAARGDVYDRWYEQKQWRRRDESASDMWRMIKRIFTQ